MRIFVFFLTALAVCQAYDYKEVLRDLLLFYEAQRSGKLPSDQRVTWRKDSALNDKGQKGEDLTGGYYDAGDYVKFGFPMAYTITTIAWGVVDDEAGYVAAGALADVRKLIKWGTDYFIKAHVSQNELYGQVGQGDVDHAYWGRPEDMTMSRPAYKIDTSHPGSDLAGETAAALATASIVFTSVDSGYAST
ncbi:endoglucanase 7-like, partial [Zootermopsis nevadensis]|uniref:endoglucanase 7-like n=1 Tax=Zootermopsis nevadensis TaxID=136037 RepID=UPI000B8EB7A5